MIKPNDDELQNIGSKTHVHAIKLMVRCVECGTKWNIFFDDWNDIFYHLPEDWHICRTCKFTGGK